LLEELDLVEVKPRSGFKIIYPDIDFMRENMQCRIMIEMHAVETFVEDVTDNWIDDQITKHNDAIAVLDTTEDLTAHNAFILDFDREFHRTIVGALKNKVVTKAHEYTQTKLGIARQVHRRTPPRKTNMVALHDHLAVLDALKTRDLNAVRVALDVHFTTSIRNTLVGY
jgi:DNA-binding GntR family transcriptional regulator